MEQLKARILRDGRVLPNSVVKVDSFLNHQVDPALIQAIGEWLAGHFADTPFTKVLTIEASGIHIAYATALAAGVPMVYAKKRKALTQGDDLYHSEVWSYTRQETYRITVARPYLEASDRVLIVDDILAEGSALLGLVDIVRQSGAGMVGIGVAIEKSFQAGRGRLEELGVRVHALARIASLEGGTIQFLE
ncbi:xanthine phosphoribosyltransferase [Alicyclobacillus sp.]|uniref:xanthine phosphoribosyltransferase n=1 Tax=Alicyclobacillus sp. TaxID=61169 RepID=UPI0025C166CE|nr:xanthine phosphoribosyltransferase [Alicyclobacillus sp.]MCL6517624.1 xanthine phosphoribosyltransferase [Alicyclobacillus sp.]